jgi:hypothetical protein
MTKTLYAAAIVKARELGYTFKRIPNFGGVYDVFTPENVRICYDYELPDYFKEHNISF